MKFGKYLTTEKKKQYIVQDKNGKYWIFPRTGKHGDVSTTTSDIKKATRFDDEEEADNYANYIIGSDLIEV